jgi:hypothetical protein
MAGYSFRADGAIATILSVRPSQQLSTIYALRVIMLVDRIMRIFSLVQAR